MDSRKIRLKALNSTITCYICRGYLIDATTVTECLHTFCKSCLLRHLEESNKCPKCELLIHQSHPKQYISYDRTMQDIVYKLVPNLYRDEMLRREEFSRAQGIPLDNPMSNPAVSCEQPANHDQSKDMDYHRNEEQISLLLSSMSEGVSGLQKPFVRVSVQATVTHLKKFIAQKLYQDMERFKDLDVLCNNELMGKDHNLKFILRTRWRTNAPPLKLEYRKHVDL